VVDYDLYDELEPMDDGDRYSWVDVVEDLEEPQRKKLKRKKRKLSRKRSQLEDWKELQDEVLGELEDAIEVYEEKISRAQGFVGGDTERFRKRVRELRQEKLGKKERFADRIDEIRDDIVELQEDIEKLEDIKPVDELL